MTINFPSSNSLAIFVLLEVVWIAAAVSIARTKTEEPTDRIAWLLIVLFFNILGVLLYVIFAPRSPAVRLSPDEYEADLKRRANEGKL